MSGCCPPPEPTPTPAATGCCGDPEDGPRRRDWLLWGSLAVCALAYGAHLAFGDRLASVAFIGPFVHGIHELIDRMAWGIAAGVVALAILGRIPREFVMSALGSRGGLSGALRATAAGLTLDLCNHGILMVGAKLYERGATLGQVFAFLVASPWNSLSTTLILIALIGWQWTLVIIGLSAVIAVVTGVVADLLVRRGVVPDNPNRQELPTDFRFWSEARTRLGALRFSWRGVGRALRDGLVESRMVLRWIFFGAILAAAIRGLLSDASLANWFGPTFVGLLLTLAAATVIEVCSEGSTPLAAELFTRAGAPGNGFAFLMAGAATDYTELLVLRETTKRWSLALLLPAIAVPQVVALGWLLNAL